MLLRCARARYANRMVRAAHTLHDDGMGIASHQRVIDYLTSRIGEQWKLRVSGCDKMHGYKCRISDGDVSTAVREPSTVAASRTCARSQTRTWQARRASSQSTRTHLTLLLSSVASRRHVSRQNVQPLTKCRQRRAARSERRSGLCVRTASLSTLPPTSARSCQTRQRTCTDAGSTCSCMSLRTRRRYALVDTRERR